MTARIIVTPRSATWGGALGIAIMAAGTAAYVGLLPVTTLVSAAMILTLAWITWRDLTTFTIPDAAVALLCVAAIVLRWPDAMMANAGPGWAALDLLVDGAVPGLLLLAFREFHFRRRGYDGLGLGDVKLAFAGGALLGFADFFWALFSASVVSLLLVLPRLPRVMASNEKVAFGAALAPAIAIVWLWQHWSSSGPVMFE